MHESYQVGTGFRFDEFERDLGIEDDRLNKALVLAPPSFAPAEDLLVDPGQLLGAVRSTRLPCPFEQVDQSADVA